MDRARGQKAVNLECVYASDPVEIHVDGEDLTDPVRRLTANFCRGDVGFGESCLQERSE